MSGHSTPAPHSHRGSLDGERHARRHRDAPRKPWAVLALALVAQVLVVLDISVVNTALPTIGRSLDLESSDLQWMVTAYLLMSGGGLLLGGRIADLLPRRRVFMTGMLVFTAASLVSGFASGAGELIAARGAQGVGAALMTPAALSLIMTTYQGAQRAKGLALWGAIGGLGIAAGVLVGGALTTWAGWQAIFWVNVPIGVVALIVVAPQVLPRETTTRPQLRPVRRPRCRHRRERLGRADVRASPAPSRTAGRRPGPWLELAVAAVLLTGFVLVERRVRAAAGPPAHLVDQAPGVRHRRDARGDRGAGRRGVPGLDLHADRPGLLRSARPGWASFRWPPPSSSAPMSPRTSSAHASARVVAGSAWSSTGGGVAAAVAGIERRVVRRRPAARPGRPRPRRGHGVRRRLGLRHGRHPRRARRAWPRGS